MRLIFTIATLSLFMFNSSIYKVNYHYCHDKVVSISFLDKAEECKSMAKCHLAKLWHCCKTESQDVVKSEREGEAQFNYNFEPELLYSFEYRIDEVEEFSSSDEVVEVNKPPPQHRPVYLMKCEQLFYG